MVTMEWCTHNMVMKKHQAELYDSIKHRRVDKWHQFIPSCCQYPHLSKGKKVYNPNLLIDMDTHTYKLKVHKHTMHLK